MSSVEETTKIAPTLIQVRFTFALCAAVAAVFGPSVSHDYVYDDFAIVSNELWRPPYTRPLTLLSFRVDRVAGPAMGHALNVALHAANSVLLTGALQAFIPLPAARAAAVVFALHPLQVEPVNYIWARSTLLMTFFCLLSLRARGWRSAAWFALALLAKEECAAFPLLLFALKQWPRTVLAAMMAMSVAAGGYALWAAGAVAGSQAGGESIYSPWSYLAAQGGVVLRYLRLLVLPTGPFVVEPEVPAVGAWAWLGVGAIVALAWKSRATIWVIGGLLLLLPSSSLFPANDLAADRRMYLPLIAFAAAFGVFPPLQRQGVLAGIALTLAALSFTQSRDWRSEQTLWTDVLTHNAGSVRARVHLARLGGDLSLLLEAKRLAPDDALVASELGRLYLEQKQIPEALAEFGRALALEPGNALAMSNRGVALLLLGQRDAARSDFERALQADPCLENARHNLRQMGFDPAPAAAGCGPSP
jgi:protein O-mannosyl-transferase